MYFWRCGGTRRCAAVQTAADNGVAPTCVDATCACPTSTGNYTYYDATQDGLNATRSSGCYISDEASPSTDPISTADPPAASPDGTGNVPAVTISRRTVLATVRFTEMTLAQVTDEFKDALCGISVARIAAVMAAGGAGDVLLSCSVTVRSGSVIATAQVIVPDDTDAAVNQAALAADAADDLTANMRSSIEQDGVLGQFGAFDVLPASIGTVNVAAVSVTPVIADDVGVLLTGDKLKAREGGTVDLKVTFSQFLEVTQVSSAVSVTGFTAADVVASVTTIPGARLLAVEVSIIQESGSWYTVRLQPNATQWSEADIRSCEYWKLSVAIGSGAAVTSNGDVSRASDIAVLSWRPAPDAVCDEEGDSDGGVKVRVSSVRDLLRSAFRLQ